MRRLAVLALALGLTGCMSVETMVEHLSKSKRSWCLYWAGGMGVGEVRISGSGVETDDGSAAAVCDNKGGSVNLTGMGQAGMPGAVGGAILTPGGDVILRAPPRILQQEPGALREIEPPPARRAPAIRPQSYPAPTSSLWRVLEASAEMQR